MLRQVWGCEAGTLAEQHFDRLLDACEALAASQGMERLLEAGVNMGRHEAYRSLIGRGFRTDIQGVTMHRPNDSGYSRLGLYVIDDWH